MEIKDRIEILKQEMEVLVNEYNTAYKEYLELDKKLGEKKIVIYAKQEIIKELSNL